MFTCVLLMSACILRMFTCILHIFTCILNILTWIYTCLLVFYPCFHLYFTPFSGHTRQGLKCKLCRMNVHPDCQDGVPKCQPKSRLLRRQKSASEIDSRIMGVDDDSKPLFILLYGAQRDRDFYAYEVIPPFLGFEQNNLVFTKKLHSRSFLGTSVYWRRD